MFEEYTILRSPLRPGRRGDDLFRGEAEALATPRSGGPSPAEAAAATTLEVTSLSKGDLASAARDPEVQGLAPVIPTRLIAPVGAGGPAAAAQAGPTWGVRAVGADRSDFDGRGVVVAVLDTGIDAAHPAFRGVDLAQRDFTAPNPADGAPDRDGHGTHCAGTIFGRDVSGTRIGVAPGVRRALIGKVLGDDGGGTSQMLFRGMQWAIDGGARVVSMSLGFDFPGLVERLVQGRGLPIPAATSLALEGYRANLRMFDQIMGMAQAAMGFGNGVVVCAASGNESSRPEFEIAMSIPAAAEDVVAVGALEETPAGLSVASFSNTLPAVCAPGVGVVSAAIGGGLRTLNGTSMATPHVAGVLALLWQRALEQDPDAKATLVVAQLLTGAVDRGFAPGVDRADRGTGIVQAP